MGPAPFATMAMAELGAEVVRIDRGDGGSGFPGNPRLKSLNRGKYSVGLDLKNPDAVETLLRMVEKADVLVDPFRPGVAERLGLGPDICLARNPKLVYARMTGWGQDGPAAMQAGHDINYIALTGALHAMGEKDGAPCIPLNLVGDFGGGANYLIIGVLAALLEVSQSGKGQVIDASIVDGVSHLLTHIHGLMSSSSWVDTRGVNLLDGGAPFYRVYETSDGKHMAVGAIEPKFYAQLIDVLAVDVDLAQQMDEDLWPSVTQKLTTRFKERTQLEWIAAFEGTDACVSPVRSLREATDDPHISSRGSLTERDGSIHAAPAPRFSMYQTGVQLSPPLPGEHTCEVLERWNISPANGLPDGRGAFQLATETVASYDDMAR